MTSLLCLIFIIEFSMLIGSYNRFYKLKIGDLFGYLGPKKALVCMYIYFVVLWSML